MFWFASMFLLKIVHLSAQSFTNLGQLTLDSGQTLRINSSEPSAIVTDNLQMTTKCLNITVERNHSFQAHHGIKWKYGIARIVFQRSVVLNANSSVIISGEHAVSITSLEGDIVVRTDINISCPVTVLGGKCVGGYMPVAKPDPWYGAPFLPGNGPGATSTSYLSSYWFNQCVGGSGHGGKGGFPDDGITAYSGLAYGQKDVDVLIGGSSGNYLDDSNKDITKPGHGGGVIQFVAKKGTIEIGAKISANAQQTHGSYEIYSGSSGGLISLHANEVRITNEGSLEVNGADAGKTNNTAPTWANGTSGGGGGIVHILANKGFISADSISLAPGGSTGCQLKEKALPGFLLIGGVCTATRKNSSGTIHRTWNGTAVFPQRPYIWLIVSSNGSSTFQTSATSPLVTLTKKTLHVSTIAGSKTSEINASSSSGGKLGGSVRTRSLQHHMSNSSAFHSSSASPLVALTKHTLPDSTITGSKTSEIHASSSSGGNLGGSVRTRSLQHHMSDSSAFHSSSTSPLMALTEHTLPDSTITGSKTSEIHTSPSIRSLQHQMSNYHGSSKTYFFPSVLSTGVARHCTTDIYHYSTLKPVAVTSSVYLDGTLSEWDNLLKNVTSLRLAMMTSRNNSSSTYSERLVERLRTLVAKEPLSETTLDKLLTIFEHFKDILNTGYEDLENVQGVVSLLMMTADASFENKNGHVWRRTQKTPLMLHILENMTLALVKERPTQGRFIFENYSKRMVVQLATFGRNDKVTSDSFRLPDFSRVNISSWERTSDFVMIPSNVLLNDQDEVTISAILYRNISDILPTKLSGPSKQQDDGFQVNSHIISCYVQRNSRVITKMASPVRLQFKFQGNIGSESICAFWNPSGSAWSTEGVTTIKTNQTHASCLSTHLTSFAILTQYTEVQVSEEDELALRIITYIGCGLSIACLFITLLVYLAFETLSTERHKVHMNLAFSLLLAQSLFLTGIKAVQYEILCRIIAVGLHYLFSAAFMWMCIEGFHLYVMVVSVFRADSLRMKYYYIAGWGFPLVVTGVAASIHPKGYGTSKACWLSTEDQFIWAFVAPVMAVIVINIIVLAVVIKVVINSASATLTRSDYAHVKAGLKSIIVLLPLLGVSWVFGLLTVNKSTIVFQYLFAFANGFQGVFIFLAHCVGSSDVRHAFKRLRQKHLLSRGSNNVTSFAPSRTDSAASAAVILAAPDSLEKEKKKKMRFAFSSNSNYKVIRVKPVQNKDDEARLQVKRTYEKPPTYPDLEPTQELVLLNCLEEIPMVPETEKRIPKQRRPLKPTNK